MRDQEPFDISHLDASERRRIRLGELTPDERAKLKRSENPWPKPPSAKRDPRPDVRSSSEEYFERERVKRAARSSQPINSDEERWHPQEWYARLFGLASPASDKSPQQKREDPCRTDVKAPEFDLSKLSPEVRKWVTEQTQSGRMFMTMEELEAAALAEFQKKNAHLPNTLDDSVSNTPTKQAIESVNEAPDKSTKREAAKSSSTFSTVWTFLRKYAAIAGTFLLGATWSMLQIDEYGFALLLLIVGMGAFSMAIYDWRGIEGHASGTKTLKIIAVVLILLSLTYHLAVIITKRGDKAWSTLLERNKEPPSISQSEAAVSANESAETPKKRTLLNKTPRQLLEIYEKGTTQLQADQLMEPFKGEWMRVRGKISRISPSHSSRVIIVLEVREDKYTDQVAASLPIKDAEEKKKFMRLAVGDLITIEGRISREQAGEFLYLVEAEYIEQ